MPNKDKKVVVDVDLQFLKCPNKKHRRETAVMLSENTGMDGFIKPGCSCAVELMLGCYRAGERKKVSRKRKVSPRGER